MKERICDIGRVNSIKELILYIIIDVVGKIRESYLVGIIVSVVKFVRIRYKEMEYLLSVWIEY